MALCVASSIAAHLRRPSFKGGRFVFLAMAKCHFSQWRGKGRAEGAGAALKDSYVLGEEKGQGECAALFMDCLCM